MAFLLNNSRMIFILLSRLILSFFLTASAQSYGTATYYTPPYMPSACYGFEDQRVMMAAASEATWNGGAACGHYYQVNYVSGTNACTPFPCQGSGSVVVKIVDCCPPASCTATIDLSLTFLTDKFEATGIEEIKLSSQTWRC